MDLRLKDLTKGVIKDAWLNRLIKTGDADPRERGEKDKDMERRPNDTAFFPKTRRKKGGK